MNIQIIKSKGGKSPKGPQHFSQNNSPITESGTILLSKATRSGRSQEAVALTAFACCVLPSRLETPRYPVTKEAQCLPGHKKTLWGFLLQRQQSLSLWE